MADRSTQIHGFLNSAGWGTAALTPLAGDASSRRYFRLTRPGESAVLMDAPLGGGPVGPFVALSQHLLSLRLSAPQIIAEDQAIGFVLMEDLGDDLFSVVLDRTPELEFALYEAAAGLLAELHRHAPPADLPQLDAAELTQMGGLAFDWYGAAEDARKQAFLAELETVLTPLDSAAPVLAHRDFHIQNLLWLPARSGARQVGLLDFQDAFAGHPAYDLASLIRDARRAVPGPVGAAVWRRYLDLTGADEAGLQAAAALLGLQRNLRILGIFARLSRRDGKAGYLSYLPIVWAHIEADLAHPAAAALRPLWAGLLPPPDEAHRATLVPE